MASLTAHLLTAEDHGRFGFHPQCPVCRQERLLGSLGSDALVSRRTQAALASGVLALSAAGPPVAMAQEPDQQLEGGSAPEQVGGGDETTSDEVDPSADGGDAAIPPNGGAPSDPVPLAPESGSPTPTNDGGVSDLREVDPGQIDLNGAPADEPASPSEPQADSPVNQEEPESTPSGPAPGVEDPDATAEAPAEDAVERNGDAAEEPDAGTENEGAPNKRESRTGEPPEGQTPEEPEGRDSAPSADASEPASQAPPPAAAPPDYAPPPGGGGAPASAPTSGQPGVDTPHMPGDPSVSQDSSRSAGALRFVTVEPGDSLWSIAKRLLGPDASPAQIAREVNRLWSLNGDRIGTGDPDLIMVGTRLKLR